MKYWMLVLVPVIAFSIGCGKPITMGTPIDKAKLEQLVPGKTPEAKVTELFGQPFKKEIVSGDMAKYTYTYYEEHPRIFREDVWTKQILNVYTQGGLVLKYDLRKESTGDI